MDSLAVELQAIFESKGLWHLAKDATVIADVVQQTLWLDDHVENAVDNAAIFFGG